MSVLQKILDVMPQADERRRFQRVRVNLLGRYMLADRREYPCQVQDMSPGGMALVAPVAGKAGERVVAYVDHLGRLEGTIVRVYPNGFAMNVAEGILRARFRKGYDHLELLKPNESYEFEIDMRGTANVFLPGHRIRVDITSSNFPQFDRNLNSGEDLATATRVRVARQTVFHTPERASHIVLPVVEIPR